LCVYIGEVKENARDVIADIVRSREYAQLEAAEDGVGVMTLYDGKGEGDAPAELVLPLKIFEAEEDEAKLVLDTLQLMLEHSSLVLTLLAFTSTNTDTLLASLVQSLKHVLGAFWRDDAFAERRALLSLRY
jgi:hypothetical protein